MKIDIKTYDFQKDMPKVEKTNYIEKICLVGAGFAGIGLANALKKNGIPFDVLEAMDNFGGNWRYGVYDTVHIISSKKTTEFKDFHMPESYPDFPSCVQMLQYFESYVAHFELLPFMEFNLKVETVELPADGEKDGSSGWIVVIKKRMDPLKEDIIKLFLLQTGTTQKGDSLHILENLQEKPFILKIINVQNS